MGLENKTVRRRSGLLQGGFARFVPVGQGRLCFVPKYSAAILRNWGSLTSKMNYVKLNITLQQQSAKAESAEVPGKSLEAKFILLKNLTKESE
ncbi:hypothetical protein [Caproicibacterium argilliputei]|uniref:Uncharacterized protein n=1 Tax=Caproicibacterium argilliputei TaxID=3030016 RepID=A0AA97H4C7_9FIRM|nr:hypothetical protein [Caproicibacterium argilliputei]WOC33258.1 hypothetical protein PXC00_05145 [Caproicibacterium argilliputei]